MISESGLERRRFTMYKVVYLPTARRQLEEAVVYIAEELCSPDAAAALLDAVDEAVRSLMEMPYRHAIYPTLYTMKREVRFIPVKNYNVHYVVDEANKTVEIWRVLHQRKRQRRV